MDSKGVEPLISACKADVFPLALTALDRHGSPLNCDVMQARVARKEEWATLHLPAGRQRPAHCILRDSSDEGQKEVKFPRQFNLRERD